MALSGSQSKTWRLEATQELESSSLVGREHEGRLLTCVLVYSALWPAVHFLPMVAYDALNASVSLTCLLTKRELDGRHPSSRSTF